MSTSPENPPAREPEPVVQGALHLGSASPTTHRLLRDGVVVLEEGRRPGPSPQPITRAGFPGRPRVVRHEVLDSLCPDDPAALRSRRDLRIINRLLGSTPWIRRTLQQHRITGEGVLELGAGGGDLGPTLGPLASSAAGLDLVRRPHAWPRNARWFEGDVMTFDRWADYPVVIANLFLHHFDRSGLARIGASLDAHARVVIASEPLRVRRTAALFILVCPLIRAHPVTRYDGRVSIAAGFRGDELPRLLQLDPESWHWQASETWRGSCRLVAVRRR